MALFEVTPYDRRIYEEELKDFLPQKILDVHTHVWLDKYLDHKPLAPGEVKRTVTWPSLVALDNSIEDLQETYRLMLPGKDVTALMFSNSGRSQQANDYVADAGLDPKDAIYQDDAESEEARPYINVWVARKADVNNETYKKLVSIYQQKDVLDALQENSGGTAVFADKFSASELQGFLSDIEKDAKAQQ